MNDLVSVCVPVYNTEKYVDDCINSIINQTYKNIEIILNNDGSSDKSLEIISKYKLYDERIIVLNNANEGLSAARNRALKIARGKYVCFIDSDDVIEKDFIEKLYNEISNNNDLSVCGFSLDYIENNYSIKTNFLDLNLSSLSDKIFYCDKIGILNSSCNKLYCMSILRNNSIHFDENVKQCEDIDYNFRYLMHVDNIGIVKLPLYHYRKFNIDSEVNAFRKDIVTISNDGISIKRNLYKRFNLDSIEQLNFLLSDNIDVLNYCLINTITYSDKRNKSEIYKIISFVLAKFNECQLSKDYVSKNMYQKIFLLCNFFGSVKFTFYIYKILLTLRHRFSKIYYRIRKKELSK